MITLFKFFFIDVRADKFNVKIWKEFQCHILLTMGIDGEQLNRIHIYPIQIKHTFDIRNVAKNFKRSYNQQFGEVSSTISPSTWSVFSDVISTLIWTNTEQIEFQSVLL